MLWCFRAARAQLDPARAVGLQCQVWTKAPTPRFQELSAPWQDGCLLWLLPSGLLPSHGLTLVRAVHNLQHMAGALCL